MGAVIDAAGGLVELILAPSGTDVTVLQPTVETAQGATVGAGDLVIALGVDPESSEAVELVELAGDAGATAVALRWPAAECAAALRHAAEAAGIGLIRIPPELAWDQVYVALESAVSAASLEPASADGSRVRPGDLHSLANAVAAMAGGPVTIEDPEARVLAHSSGAEPLDEPRRASILERRTPEDWQRRFEAAGVYRQLWNSDDVVRIDEFVSEGLRPRLAVAVRVGDELLGSIWVAEGSQPLGAASETALVEAARIAAVHLARRRSTADVERRVRGDLLHSLLEGRGPPDVVAARLGLPASGPFAVIAFGFGDEADHAMARDRVVGLVGLRLEAWAPGSASVAVRNAVYALVPLGERSADELAETARELVDRVGAAIGARIYGGMAAPVANLGSAAAARSEADAVLASMGTSGRDFCTTDDVRPSIILSQLRARLGDASAKTGLLDTVKAHDTEAGTHYLLTLRSFLDAFGDVSAASKRLGVHPNTFRYRLRRMPELFGLDLDDPDERLAVQLELALWLPED